MYNTLFSKKLKLISVTASLIILSLMLALVSSPGSTSAASTGQEPTKRTINVSGQGTVNAVPDIAYVTIGVITENENAKVAQQDNAEEMSKVVNAILGAGISEDDIKTTNYNISPKYNYIKETGTSVIAGYSVTNQIQVTVRDVAKVGDIIDLAASNGANMSSNISFSVSDYEKYYNEALKVAVENGKKRAETIANTIGITLGVPVTINENGGYYSPVVRSVTYDLNAKAESVTTPIAAGIFEIKASVSMVYEY